MLRWCDQKIINLPRTWACPGCSENFSRILSSLFPPVSSSDSATCKTAGQSREGWLIALQSLSVSPDKETLDYTLGSKCWIHTVPLQREREKKNVQRPSPGKFCAPPSSLVLRTLCFVFGNQIMHSPSICRVWVGTEQQQSTLFLFIVAKTNVNEHLPSSNHS